MAVMVVFCLRYESSRVIISNVGPNHQILKMYFDLSNAKSYAVGIFIAYTKIFKLVRPQRGPLVWHWRNNRIVFLQAYQIGATVVNIQRREGGLFRCPTGDRSDPVGPPFELHPRNQSDVLSTADNHLGRIRAPCGLYSAHRAAPPPYIQPYAGPIIGFESSPCQSLEEV
ncbi:hypothetical protein J6590_006299 [Homalodisca vitripennis]|nr:hypothetical protein J6590_006299 [Homalodisca vitripennis]